MRSAILQAFQAGCAPRVRLIDHAPAGRWNTQTFIAGLRHDRIDATGIINGAMDKEMFDLYVKGILAPTLRPGDVVILDNLPAIAVRRRRYSQGNQSVVLVLAEI